MKILFVCPEYGKSGFGKNTKMENTPTYKIFLNTAFRPNLPVLTLAALTPKEHTVEIVDEIVEDINFDINYDIVGITTMTPSAFRAYEIADEFRRRGVTVVLGGWHPSVLPEEAKEHADSVVIGEAEELWGNLLKDYSNNKLKPFYKQTNVVDLSSVPKILNERKLLKYKTLPAGIEATRGCTVGCKFCPGTCRPFYREFRRRAIEDVIEELQHIDSKFVSFVDSSLTFDPSYAKKLFREMKGLNKKFFAMGNISLIENDDELLQLAADAGLIQMQIGLESSSQEAINSVGKYTNKVDTYSATIRKIQDYGIGVVGCFMFGFETDTLDIFQRTTDFLKDINLNSAYLMILTPYPGTPFYTQFEAENRILTRDWSKYDLDHVVFQPKNMTPEELLDGVRTVAKEYMSPYNIIKRIVMSTKIGFHLFLSITTLSLIKYRWAKRFLYSKDYDYI